MLGRIEGSDSKTVLGDPTQHATGKPFSLYFIMQDLRTQYNEYGKSVPFNQPFFIAFYSLLTQFLNTEALAFSVFLKNTVFLHASEAYLRTQYFDSFPWIFLSPVESQCY